MRLQRAQRTDDRRRWTRGFAVLLMLLVSGASWGPLTCTLTCGISRPAKLAERQLGPVIASHACCPKHETTPAADHGPLERGPAAIAWMGGDASGMAQCMGQNVGACLNEPPEPDQARIPGEFAAAYRLKSSPVPATRIDARISTWTLPKAPLRFTLSVASSVAHRGALTERIQV